MNFHYSEQQAASYLGVFCVFEWRKVQSASNEEAMRLKLHLFVGKWIAESYAPLCNVQYTTIILQFGGENTLNYYFCLLIGAQNATSIPTNIPSLEIFICLSCLIKNMHFYHDVILDLVYAFILLFSAGNKTQQWYETLFKKFNLKKVQNFHLTRTLSCWSAPKNGTENGLASENCKKGRN